MNKSLVNAANKHSRGKVVSISVPALCFCILFLIWCLKKIYLFSSPMVLQVFDILEWPIYLLGFIAGFIRAHFRPKDFVIIAVVGAAFMVTYFVTGSAELLKSVLLIVIMRQENYGEIINRTYFLYIFSIVLTISLYILGISDAGEQRRGATSLGYIQANAIGFICMMLTIYAFQKSPIKTKMTKIGLIVISIIGFILSDSRTGCLLAVLVVLFSNMRVYSCIHQHKTVQLLLALFPCFCFVFSIGTAMTYTSNIISQLLDTLFTSRIWMNYYLLKTYGFSLFGQNISVGLTELIENPVTHAWTSYMTVDCAYIGIPISLGVVTAVIICILYFSLVRKLVKNQAYATIIATTAILLYGITESSIISIYVFLPFLLLFNKHPGSWDNLRVSSLQR